MEAGVRALELSSLLGLVVAAALASRRRHAVLFGAAAVVLAVTMTPPVHDAAHRSVTGHMVQHLLIVLVVAPMAGVAVSEQPGRWRRRRVVRQMTAILVRTPSAPVIAGAVHALTMMVWHLPGLYDAALRDGVVHALEHVSMVATGVWWWASLSHHARRATLVAPALSLFLVATSGAVLGVLMMFAPRPLYAHGGTEDQQIAGALMAGGTGGLQMVAGVALVAMALTRLDAPRPLRFPVVPTVLMTAAIFGVAAAAIGPTGRADGSAQRGTEHPTLGRDLYRRDCAACHGPAGAGSDRGVDITELGTAGVFYALSTGRMPIARPDDPIRRSPPAYDVDEIEAIVEYTSQFVDGPALPTLDGDGDVALGGTQYRLHCAACHSATGIGGAQAFDREAPSVLHATPDETAAAIVAGPGGMPGFRSTFSDREIGAIAEHVQLLQDPPTTGLAIPGGRVGEGLVAWLAAVAVLVLAAAWIGRRP